MIRVNPTTSSLNTNEFYSTKETKKASKGLIISSGACCYGCEVDLPVFVNLTDLEDKQTNDKTDFLLSVGDTDTVLATLTKINSDGTETDYVISDNTYGDYYSKNTIKTNFWGFIIVWSRVQSVLGYGKYKLNITVTDVSSNDIYDEDSSCFFLQPYSCDNAHRTIKIFTKQSGYFEGGIDYTGIYMTIALSSTLLRTIDYWPQEIRLFGRFHRSGTTLITDNIVTQSRGQEQVQSQTIKTFILKLDNILPKVSNKIVYDVLQAPDVLISDFNYNNDSVEKNTRVSITNFSETVNIPLANPEFFTIEFNEYFQNNIHRYR